MSLAYYPRTSAPRAVAAKESGLPAGFILGVAVASLIWAALGVGTTLAVSSSVVAEAPSLTLTR